MRLFFGCRNTVTGRETSLRVVGLGFRVFVIIAASPQVILLKCWS